MSFLTAEWRKLAFANYEIDPDLLKPYLPHGTEMDIWNGRCYVSLVGFMFQNVRLLGLKIPFHTEFEEVNLRFYVRRNSGGAWRRGVVFINEFVPKFAISWVANTLYREHYKTMPMRHQWATTQNSQSVLYEWKQPGSWSSFKVEAALNRTAISPGSEAEFITEHYWGYSKRQTGKTIEYQVTHPKWAAYPVKNYGIVVDFAQNYGEDFRVLNQLQPTSVMLAEGSAITIESRKNI